MLIQLVAIAPTMDNICRPLFFAASRHRNFSIYSNFLLICSSPARNTVSSMYRGGHKEMSSILVPLAPSYMSPNAGEGGSCGVSANEYSCAYGAQINFGGLTPFLTYVCTFQQPFLYVLNRRSEKRFC
jgi:hypothetical protein